MKDIIQEVRALQTEIMRLKSKDKARPMIADVPMSGSYIVPDIGINQTLIATVTSELRDWPQMSASAYVISTGEQIDPPFTYRITENGLSTVNRFALSTGRAIGGQIRLDWYVLSQTGKSVSFEVR